MIVHYHDSASRNPAGRRHQVRVELMAHPSVVRTSYRSARIVTDRHHARWVVLGIYGTPLIYGDGE